MESLLYSFFIESNQNSLVSYQRIKRFLSNVNLQEEIKRNELSSLYKLLNYGVIDYTGDNKYYLCPSMIIKSENYKIGINLSSDILALNRINIINQKSGITIFNNQEILLEDWNLKIINYKFEHFFSCFSDIFKIPSKWTKTEFPTYYTKGEKLNVEILKWEKFEKPSTSNSLYKIHPFSSDFFDYYFYYNQNWYKLNIENFEKVNLSKTILALKNKLEFNIYQDILSIPFNFPLPTFIEKFLFLNHCLTLGTFPENRKYFIKKKEFKKLNKIVFRNNIKIKANE